VFHHCLPQLLDHLGVHWNKCYWAASSIICNSTRQQREVAFAPILATGSSNAASNLLVAHCQQKRQQACRESVGVASGGVDLDSIGKMVIFSRENALEYSGFHFF
jgi:hypothetical protein